MFSGVLNLMSARCGSLLPQALRPKDAVIVVLFWTFTNGTLVQPPTVITSVTTQNFFHYHFVRRYSLKNSPTRGNVPLCKIVGIVPFLFTSVLNFPK